MTTSGSTVTAPGDPGRTADPGIQEFLTRLSVAMGRRRAYAPDHPMVARAEAALLESLHRVLAHRSSLPLAVARQELLADGAALSRTGSGTRELAERLHRRGVGSLTFHTGVDLPTLRAALEWLSAPPPADGSLPGGALPDLPTVVIRPVAYDHLALGEEERVDRERVAELWRELASVALEEMPPPGPGSGHGGVRPGPGGPDADRAGAEGNGGPQAGLGGGDRDEPPPEAVAAAIERRVQNEPYAKRVAFVLLSLADQVAQAPPAQRRALAERLQAVIRHLGESSIARIIRSVGIGPARRRLLSQLIDLLPITAVIEWLEVAARATDQELSHHLLRLLAKLSALAGDTAEGSRAEEALRGAAHDLVADWGLTDPNPTEHLELLDHIALSDRAAAGSEEPSSGDIREAEAARLVQMALEVGVAGEDTLSAADRLVGAGHLLLLFDWLAAAPSSAGADRIREHVASAAAVREVLLRDPVELGAARTLLRTLDIRAAGALVDVLELAEDRRVRRLVYDRLVEFGPEVAPLLVPRLEGAPWFLLRNLLSLLRELRATDGSGAPWPLPPNEFAALLDHEHDRVRAEAFRLLMLEPAARDATLRIGLEGGNETLVLLSLEAALERPEILTPELATRLVRVVERPEVSEGIRVRAVTAMAARPIPPIRDWLVRHVTRRTRFLRRLALKDGGPTVLAALEVLGRVYGSDPAVAPILELARRRGGSHWVAVRRGSRSGEVAFA